MADEQKPVILDNQVNITIRDPNAPKKPVIQGTVKRVKGPKPKEKWTKKFIHAVLGQDVDDPGKYILDNYLVPTGLRMINNTGQTVLKKLSDGLQVGCFGRVVNQNGGFTDYTSYSNPGVAPVQPKTFRLMDSVETFAFATRADADRVLNELRGRLQAYGSISVLDYYEMVGAPADVMQYVLKDRGWVNLDNARVMTSAEGFIIDLPRPISLKG